MKIRFIVPFLILTTCQVLLAQRPVDINGKLKLVGLQLSSECGYPVQLKGMSTHGPQWFSGCYNDSSIAALANKWGADVIRLAMYVEQGGYTTNPVKWRTWIDSMVDKSGRQGVYCLIDWHIVQYKTDSAGNPHTDMKASMEFWDYMSKKHGGKKHVLYEICNEPSGAGVDWPTIKSYADTIIHVIRKNDPETMIIVGTPSWSGNPAIVVGDELPDSINHNVMYTYHFYATTHKGYVSTLQSTVAKIPIFVTEWGTSMSSGTGQLDFADTDKFMDVMGGNNPAGVTISWCNWSFADNTDSSSALSPNSCSAKRWTSMSKSGKKVFSLMSVPDKFALCTDNPIIFQDPRDQTVIEGNSASFHVSATGVALSFQWQSSADSLQWDSIPGADSAAYMLDTAGLSDALYYRVIVGDSLDTLISNAAKLTILKKGPFFGTPLPIPGIIEAEYYDIGNSGVAYLDKSPGNSGGAFRNDDVDVEPCSDAGGGYDVGYVEAGDWLSYTVDVKDTGVYDITFRMASASTTAGRFLMRMKGKGIFPLTNAPLTGGWQIWKDLTIRNIRLDSGVQQMRVDFSTGNVNLNYVSIQKSIPVGLSIQELASTMSLFPNPASEVLYLTSAKYELTGGTIEVVNAMGVTLQSVVANAKNVELDIHSLPSGMYLVRVPIEGKNVYLKWLKN